MQSPKPAAMLHLIISRMDRGSNALVISHSNLGRLMGVKSVNTIKRYLAVLIEEKWIQSVSLGAGSVNAYVVNSAVAWGRSRDQLTMSQFTAQVITTSEDQISLDSPDLRKIPVVFSHERQVPSGSGLEPPAQPSLEGLEPDLPSRNPR